MVVATLVFWYTTECKIEFFYYLWAHMLISLIFKGRQKPLKNLGNTHEKQALPIQLLPIQCR